MQRPLVEFIKLKKPEKARFLCELAEEFFNRGQRVLITVNDDNQGVTLDRFMWTWRKGGFVPHCFDNGAVDCLDEPVVITTEERNGNGARILILGKPVSFDFVRGFDQVIDFAESYDESLLQESRRRFVAYREAGLAPRMR
ncbi:DNA polymerase III subunit chi [Geoalkalibacter halelectricus]|uniref:DNA polymerase III subunit chi n=1 Tax=Geoalkalibacter halelectricus TaxID=2847045 RepID=A0ABY5ZRP6_9BACT|nr:DNA polymerase III subunit chi [Geoalkalibacter halelectricus]MDO3376692.1 DNA polymerase III subunit chi [Geoalkalibacter halelectricus]UWZ81356.1 DNA polymerase III subunit chi [Geoalkalibacter halelectricus]